jgi:uncharacterized protein involved in exopolysaccharide biosynthesis
MEAKEPIDLDFSHYLLAVRRHWIPAATIFASTVALSLIAASLIKSSYQAEGRLIFKNPAFKVVGTGVVPSNTEGGESGDLKSLVSTQNPLTTQMELLTSRPLLQRLIEQLSLKNDKGKKFKVADFKPILSVKIVGGTDVIQVNYKDRNPRQAAKIVNTLMNLYLENDIETTSAEAEAARKFMDDQLPKTAATDE